MTKKIIAICGLIGSGKDEAAKYISEKYGYQIIDYAELLREICRKDGLEVTRDNLQNTRLKYGNTFLAEMAVERIKKSQSRKMILTPMRRSEDFLISKKAFPAAKMILINAPEYARFERVHARKRENYPETIEEFRRQENRDKSIFDFDKTFSFADYRVENTGTLTELKKKVDKIMKEIERT